MKMTRSYLQSLMVYHPRLGIFIWKSRRPGSIAGRFNSKGRRQICVDGKAYTATHLAWLYMTGKLPPDQIDHKNTIENDDRWSNLRLATNGQNRANSKFTARSGFKGVYKNRHRWMAKIRTNRRLVYLGNYRTKGLAHAAYSKAAKRYHKQFARMK